MNSLSGRTPQNTLTWLLQFGGQTYGATPFRVGFGDGTESLLSLSNTGVGVVNGSGFLHEFRSLATANRIVNLFDAAGTLYPETLLITTADFTNSTVTATAVTGLSFTPSASSTYEFEGVILVSSAATTTGPQIKITGPSETSWVAYSMHMPNNLGTNEVVQYGTAWGTVFASIQLPAANTLYPVLVRGVFRTTSSAPSSAVQVWLQSEVAASNTTVGSDSFLVVKKRR